MVGGDTPVDMLLAVSEQFAPAAVMHLIPPVVLLKYCAYEPLGLTADPHA
jgi:hypothetical protein